MLKYELKKIVSKRINQLVLLLLFAVALTGSFLALRDVRCYQEDGTVLSGFSAVSQLKQKKARWKGPLTKEVIKQAVEENQKNNASAGGEDAILARRQGYDDIRELVNLAFSPLDAYNYYTADTISPQQAEGLYQERIKKLKQEFSNSGKTTGNYSKNQKDFLIRQYESLKTPLYYEYAEGWKALLDSQYLPTLMIIVIVMIGFLVSGIFSDEFQYKSDSIFFSARLGRNRAIAAKIGAGFLTVSIAYWSVMLLFSAIILGVAGFEGAGCMIQTGDNWESLYNLTYAQDWLLSMSGGYVANLFILFLAMLVSAKSRSTALAITIPFVLSCAPMFLGRISLLAGVMNFFPDMLLRISKFLDVLLVCEVGGKVMGLYPFLTAVYLLFGIALAPVLYFTYRRAEVK